MALFDRTTAKTKIDVPPQWPGTRALGFGASFSAEILRRLTSAATLSMALFDRTTAKTKLDVPRQWLDSRAMKRPLPSVNSFRAPICCLVCAEAFLALFGARGLRVLWSLALGIWSFFPSSRALAAAPENWSTNASASLSNGSFETGTSSPEGWQLHPGGSWVTDMAHGGAHSLRGDAKRQALIGESESVVVEPGADYRVDRSEERRVGKECRSRWS